MSSTVSPSANREHANNQWLSAILDEIDYGIVSYGERGVVQCNRTAEAQIADPSSPLRNDEGHIHAVDPKEDRTLQAALHDGLAHRRRRLLTLHGAGRPLPVAVVPLVNERDAEDGPAAMIVTGKRDLCPTLTAYWFCVSHRLSPAESSVLSELLAGFQPRAIAERKGVALSTVRTQINTIGEKTATRGIRELMILAAGLPPMISMALQ